MIDYNHCVSYQCLYDFFFFTEKVEFLWKKLYNNMGKNIGFMSKFKSVKKIQPI